MQIPAWLLPRPPMPADEETSAAFDALLSRARASGPGAPIEYSLSAPKWQFLAHVAERRGLVLHGSGNHAIARFEPRQADDVDASGNQKAVYGASDGVWPIFFAIFDRARFPSGIVINTCLFVPGEPEPFYFFSISRPALAQNPWREGSVYLLPPDTFERAEPVSAGSPSVMTGQVASASPVAPLARLAVAPADFPFLEQVRGHDDPEMIARARANPGGFPWLEPA
ncbi:MAG: hypothetical protein J2P38_02810 [Candidatus Dormibacteraeota bacterium]|nr:hypothetical protein [Candidatus Dormibacteraeota bacterium]